MASALLSAGCASAGTESEVASPVRSTSTSTTVTRAPEPEVARGPVLSAFFGLDEGLPATAAGICAEAPGQDGLVVNVADELDPTAMQPDRWTVVTRSGRRAVPVCASLRPAIDPGERRTVLLIGELGSIADPPVRIEIPDGLATADPTLSGRYRGVSFEPVTPLAEGPLLVIAERVDAPVLGGRATGPDGCPMTTAQVVRVAWAGGVTRPDGAPTGDDDSAAYLVTVRRPDGSTRKVRPAALADVNDNDNYHVLCLVTTDRVVDVGVDAGHFVDPNGDLNPDTHLEVATR